MYKKFLKSIVLLLVAVMLVGVLVACDKPEEKTPDVTDPAKEYVIGYLVWSMAEEFHVDVFEGAEAKAKEIGNIKLVGPDPEGDMQKEISLIEDMIQSEVDALIIAPVDADAIVPYIKRVKDAGIPVINYDIDVEAEVDAKCLSNNAAGGAMACDYLIKRMGDTGKILILTEVPGVVTADERITGFKDRLAEIAPNVEVIEQLSTGTRDTHRSTTENMLQAYPDITGIFCFMGDNTLGAYVACKSNDRQDVLIAGYDASPEQVQIMMEDGDDCNLICTVDQSPRLIGSITVDVAWRVLQGEKFNDIVYTDVALVTTENVDSFGQ